MEGICAFLKKIYPDRLEIFECQALASASSLLGMHRFDLAILDMSIHSHEPEAGAGSPFPLSSGGLEVLFEIEHVGLNTHCIILTQYPDIDIEEIPIPVEAAQKEILDKFDIRVAGCVRYFQNDDSWELEVSSILEKL
ncbi:MAG: hypothetical protein Q7W55_13590 [Pseudohongiella sp.]|nr:hypothetical protein [Pseudohongiella sp.]